MNYSPSFKNQTGAGLTLDQMFDGGVLKPMDVDGLYARTGRYESVVMGLTDFITRHREAGTEIFRFPPVMSRKHIERHGYLKSFPNLLGCVCGLHGTEKEIRDAADSHYKGEDWTKALAPNDLVLTPAACYPVYPVAAERGPVPAEGYMFDVAADCFRREPSKDVDRLQSFRMREYVRIGTPEQIGEFRERWIKRATAMTEQLGLPYRIDQASDPFFGRTGQMMAISQFEQCLKFELLIPTHSAEKPTACMSFNYHLDHFGTIWDLADAKGTPSHTGCVAFGMDRLAVAMFATHGIDPAKWPAPVRKTIGL
jgi:seryl-tRNA synthetase